MTAPRQTMNGKPVLRVPVKTVLNMESKFGEKLLSDGPALALGDACAYSCSFCYVPAVYRKLDRIRDALAAHNAANGTALRHEDVVILREGALDVLRGQLLDRHGRRRFADPADRRVVYSSPADDVAANMDLARATAEACALILEHTHWQIRLLSKSNLLPKVAEMLAKHERCDRILFAGQTDGFTFADIKERLILGFSTGTLDDGVARAFEEGTPLVSKRIEALHQLQDDGFRTFGMVCPSLPMAPEAYDDFSRQMLNALRPDKLEHVWAEVINLRGESFTRTVDALRAAGKAEEARFLEVVQTNPDHWEQYNRNTFNAHAAALAPWPGKLRYLTYVTPRTRDWWREQAPRGAVLLGEHSNPNPSQP